MYTDADVKVACYYSCPQGDLNPVEGTRLAQDTEQSQADANFISTYHFVSTTDRPYHFFAPSVGKQMFSLIF